jgi:hypothetical protein
MSTFLNAISTASNPLFSQFKGLLKMKSSYMHVNNGVDSTSGKSQLQHDICHMIANQYIVDRLMKNPIGLRGLAEQYLFDFCAKASFSFNGERLVIPFEIIMPSISVAGDNLVIDQSIINSTENLTWLLLREYRFNFKQLYMETAFGNLAYDGIVELTKDAQFKQSFLKEVISQAKGRHRSTLLRSISSFIPLERDDCRTMSLNSFVCSLDNAVEFEKARQAFESEGVILGSIEQELDNLYQGLIELLNKDNEWYDEYYTMDFCEKFVRSYFENSFEFLSIDHDLNRFITHGVKSSLYSFACEIYSHIIGMDHDTYVLGTVQWFEYVKSNLIVVEQGKEVNNQIHIPIANAQLLYQLYLHFRNIDYSDLSSSTHMHLAYYKLFKPVDGDQAKMSEAYSYIESLHSPIIEQYLELRAAELDGQEIDDSQIRGLREQISEAWYDHKLKSMLEDFVLEITS